MILSEELKTERRQMSKLPSTAIVLAGGQGTRLRSVVPNLPKPMALVNGKPFLSYLFRYWHNQGIKRFVVSTGYLAEVIENYFSNRYAGAEIVYAHECEPLGTGGALINSLSLVNQDEPIIALNGDTYFEIDLKALSNFSWSTKADWCLSLFNSNEDERYLLMQRDLDGRLNNSAHINNHMSSNQQCANGGVYWVHPAALASFSVLSGKSISLESEILPQCFNLDQNIFGLISDNLFIDIGLPQDYQRAQVLNCFDYNVVE